MVDISHSSKVGSRVVMSIIATLLIIAFGVWSSDSEKPLETKDITLTAVDAAIPALEEDVDSDGLKNWQEDIWGTKTDNPDTDGDGTSDGDEVKFGRNPLKKAPGDKIERTDFITPKKTTGDYFYDDDPTLTTTDIIGRDVFSAYVAMKVGGTLSPEAMDTFAKQAADKVSVRTPTFQTPYAAGDAVVVQNDSAEAYKAYANALGAAFTKYYGDTPVDQARTNEMRTIQKGVLTEDKALLQTLEKNVAQNTLFATVLIKIPVPSGLVNMHVAMANDYNIIAQSLGRIQNLFDDPVGNMSALQVYQKTLEDMVTRSAVFRSEIAAKQIIFSPSDPAYPYFGVSNGS